MLLGALLLSAGFVAFALAGLVKSGVGAVALVCVGCQVLVREKRA